MGLMSWLRDGGSWLRGGARAGDGARTGHDGVRADDDHGVRAEHGHHASAVHAAPRERADLSELPPIQRTLGDQGLIVNPSGFEETLSTRRDVALGTPLGHLVSPDAPTGLVHGVTAPAPAEHGDDVGQPSAPAPDGARDGVTVRDRYLPMAPPASVGAAAPGSLGVQRAVGGQSAAMTSAGGSAAELPVRHLVGERAVTTVPGAPGSAPGDVPAAPAVQRTAMPSAGERARRAPGLGAPLPALPPTAQRRAAATDAGAAPRTGTGSETGAGAAEEAGAVPPGASLSREASGSDAPTAPLLGDDPRLSVAPDPAPVSGAAVQRRSTDPLVPAPLSPLPASGPVAPLLADRPLTPPSLHGGPIGAGAPAGSSGGTHSAAVQRAGPGDGSAGTGHGPESGYRSGYGTGYGAESGAGAGAGFGNTPGSGPGFLPDAVPVRWTSEGTGSPGAAWAPTASLSAAVPVQRATAPSTSAGGSASASARGAYPRQLPGVQRRSADGPPVPRSAGTAGGRNASASPAASAPGSSASADGFTTAGDAAVAAGVAQRMADGSVVFGPPTPTYTSSTYTSSTYTSSTHTPQAYPAPVVQRETESEEPPPPEPPPYAGTEADPEPEPEPESGPEPAGTTAGSAAPPGAHPPTPGGAAPVVTDELVRALYPPLSRLFKADLRLERERAGFLINTRH